VREMWAQVVVTPAYTGIEEASTFVFFPGTHQAAPLVAKAELPFVVFTDSQAGLEEVKTLLRNLSISPAQYQVWNLEGRDPWATFQALEIENPSTRFHPVAIRPHWLKELLAGLEEMGVLPVMEGDLDRAVGATQRYFQAA
jgi:hypothetical protein